MVFSCDLRVELIDVEESDDESLPDLEGLLKYFKSKARVSQNED